MWLVLNFYFINNSSSPQLNKVKMKFHRKIERNLIYYKIKRKSCLIYRNKKRTRIVMKKKKKYFQPSLFLIPYQYLWYLLRKQKTLLHCLQKNQWLRKVKWVNQLVIKRFMFISCICIETVKIWEHLAHVIYENGKILSLKNVT